MRTILVVGLTAAGIALAGTPGASAAPVNGGVIGGLATVTDPITTVQHWRGGSHGGARRRGSPRGPLGGGRLLPGGALGRGGPGVAGRRGVPRAVRSREASH